MKMFIPAAFLTVATVFPALAQLPTVAFPTPTQTPNQTPTVRTTAEEVLLDLVVRDKKGKPVADLKPEDITVQDNGVKQTLTSFRLVSGSEAISSIGSAKPLDALRQVRLVTLAFEAMSDISQRKLARSAALDLIKGDQGTNVFYSVVVIDTRLLTLQKFTTDRAALTKAIERATEGISAPRLSSESDAITAELKRQLAGQAGTGADVNTNLLAAASQAGAQPVASGDAALQAKLASVMLDMLRLDAAAGAQGTRLTLSALKSLVLGLREMPGRKSVLYFTWGMYLTPELDVPFRNLISFANRENVTFYSVDSRGVMTSSQNSGATSQLNGATAASRTTVTRLEGGTSKDEMMSSDNAEVSARANIDMPLRDLAESTGGFLIGDSNDLRVPVRHVNEEIASYYELSYNPGIQNYDGSFRKLGVTANRKDLVIHSRSGYFALPAEAGALGLAPFELPLLTALTSGKLSDDLKFRSGATLLQPKSDGVEVAILMEVPLREFQATHSGATWDIHCSLGALVKDVKGEVVHKITRDRSFHVTEDQQRLGNFLDKTEVPLAPGKYTLETAVIDQEGTKMGVQRSEFTVPARTPGVSISSLLPMRSYTPNAKNLDAAEPFQFQGGSVTPTMDTIVKKAPNSVLRLFFTVYPDPGNAAKPTVDIEFLLAGKILTKVPMPLPAADSLGRIPYLMTIPAESIPAGDYEIRAAARQGDSTSAASTRIRIE
jgi:VWFA-related protein